MSTGTATQIGAGTAAPATSAPQRTPISGVRIILITGYTLAIALVLTIAVYGFSYYTAGATDRPFSEKHHILKPTGTVGLKLGFLGFLLFLGIFVYPLRKNWSWLAKKGNSKNWLDIHVLMGLSLPFIILLHSSFKFRGFAGMAFWIMAAVSASGVIGRYVYNQIPRRMNTAELSMRELQDQHAQLAANLAAQRLLPHEDLASLLHMPSKERVARMNMVVALLEMVGLDLLRSVRVARLRRRAVSFGEVVLTLGGYLRTRYADLETAIESAREQAALMKRTLFLSRAQQVFHLWHVVHKPFSYSFAILAVIHVGVAVAMGYVPWR